MDINIIADLDSPASTLMYKPSTTYTVTLVSLADLVLHGYGLYSA